MKDLRKIALLSAIAIIAYLVYKETKNNKAVVLPVETNPETLKVGSFSKEIERLQQNINDISGKEVIEVSGAYSKKMQEIVRLIFNDSDLLLDKASGELEMKQLSSLNYILENISKNIIRR